MIYFKKTHCVLPYLDGKQKIITFGAPIFKGINILFNSR